MGNETSTNDLGYIDTPTREGYVFSHWSKFKPGSYTKARDSKGAIIGIKNECPPFDFKHETITNDMKLYAVFTPKVTATFVSVGDDGVEKSLYSETTTPGGSLYDPVEAKSILDLEAETKQCIDHPLYR